MYFSKALIVSLLGVVSIVASLIFASTTYAAVTPSGLTVSPLRSEIALDPGTSTNVYLDAANNTDTALQVSFSAAWFKTVDPEYNYSFSVDSNLAQWVHCTPDSATILPHRGTIVTCQISVPLNAEPGGDYISLFASSDLVSNSGVTTRQRVGSLIYLTVNGNVSRAGVLWSLQLPLLTISSTAWTAMIQDKGSTHFQSRYTVDEKTLIGTTIVRAEGSSLILPNTVRLVSGTLPNPPFPGIYALHYTIGLGDSPAAQETKWILYMPPWMTAVLLGLISFALIWWVRKRQRN